MKEDDRRRGISATEKGKERESAEEKSEELGREEKDAKHQKANSLDYEKKQKEKESERER